MYYHICPHCGASLDPGEICDCQKRKAASAATEHGKDCACTHITPLLYTHFRKMSNQILKGAWNHDEWTCKS